jgi:hypothetical protein
MSPEFPRAEPLLNPESRARLPHLYSQENKGLDVLAQVKFFSLDAGWSWYASEGSPVDEDGYYDTGKEKIDYFFFVLTNLCSVTLG